MNGTVDEYSDTRHRIGARVIKQTERARKMVMATDPWRKGLVRSLFWLVGHMPFMKKRMFREMVSL